MPGIFSALCVFVLDQSAKRTCYLLPPTRTINTQALASHRVFGEGSSVEPGHLQRLDLFDGVLQGAVDLLNKVLISQPQLTTLNLGSCQLGVSAPVLSFFGRGLGLL